MTTKRTQSRPTAPARPVLEAERRAAAAERRADSQAEQHRASADRVREVERKAAADLAEMREDRDRWRAQAEKLAGALERLRAPAPAPVMPAATQTTGRVEGDDDLLYGVPSIAKHMNLKPAQVYHLHRKGAIPLFKIGRKTCWSKSGIARWLAAQPAATTNSGEVH